MKKHPMILIGLTLSLTANLMLGLALANTASHVTPPPGITQASRVSTRPAGSSAHDQPRTGAATLWAQVSSPDHSTLIANLRKAGLSPKLLRAIAIALVEEKYRSSMIEAYEAGENTPYWKTTNVFYGGDKRLMVRHQLDQKIAKEVNALLGNSHNVVTPEMASSLRKRYGNLSQDKLQKLIRIQEDYNELHSPFETGATMLPADREKFALLRKEQRADIEKLLTTEELFEYDLRNSSVGDKIKRETADLLNLSEMEYRALFSLFQSIENQMPTETGSNHLEINQARESAEAKIQDQIKTALGEARYADYTQVKDRQASLENRLVVRLGLSLSTAAQLVGLRNEYRDLSKAISTDRSLTPEQKAEQITALNKDSESKITSLIGQRGLEAYQQYGGAAWLSSEAVRGTPSIIRVGTP